MTGEETASGQAGGAAKAMPRGERGFAVSQRDPTTDRGGCQRVDLHLPDGRIGGVLWPGGVLRKVCQWSKHFHRRLRGWGIDAAVLLEARERGARVVEVVDTERGETWQAPVDLIITHGLRFDFGHGLQCFLAVENWHKVGEPDPEPEPVQMALWG